MASGRYGRIQVDNVSVGAHRYSYELHHGPIANELYVCHRCDIPLCVNPAHLFLGTAKENWDDMIAKGRNEASFAITDQHGTCNAHAKLDESQVLNIRRLRAEGVSYRAIKARFGIKSNGHLRNIVTGKLWGHLKA